MDYSLGTRVADLLAIAALLGPSVQRGRRDVRGGGVDCACGKNPERVDKLVLRDPFASGERFYAETKYGQVATATTGITREQWEIISQTIAAAARRKE